MKQSGLSDITNEPIVKTFSSRDVFYNNGIVNFYQFLSENSFDLKYKLDQYSLSINIDLQKEKEIYIEILSAFLKNEKIVYQTDNDRWYFDENRMDFVVDKKFDTKGGQKNDLRNGVYLYKNIKDLGINREEAEQLYLNFCTKTGWKGDRESNGTLKVPNKKNELIVLITLDEAVLRFADYLIGSDALTIDSKIHTFEDGQNYFHDMLNKPKSYKIDKWDALFYWFGSRTKRLYNFSYFIYPNSTSLEALSKFKEFMQIGDDKIEYRNEKEKLISTSSNIDFFQTLSKDEIVNKHFYISRSTEEFEVKFFMYLFSLIYHIEERYEKSNERRRERQKELFETLQYMSFVTYTDDGTFKTSLNEYTKAYQLLSFFEELKKSELFKCLADVMAVFSLSLTNKKEVNLNLTRWCQNLLGFSSLQKEYFLTSFDILKNDSKGFGKNLFELESYYINHILGGKNMSVHVDAKIVGDGIGHFCAELKDKDLLFKLRNIKNYKQLISFFKDVKFSSLKNERESRFSNDFNRALETIIEKAEQDWEIARDYIAIYAIDKFKAVSYAKNQN